MRAPQKATASMRQQAKIWLAILAVLVLLDFLVKPYQVFGIDGTFGFAAWYGALACLGLVMLALVVGSLLRAPETSYDD